MFLYIYLSLKINKTKALSIFPKFASSILVHALGSHDMTKETKTINFYR